MAQHSLKQRIQKDKLLQHSYYCIEEPMQSGGETGRENRDFNTWKRTNKDTGPALFKTDDFCVKPRRQMISKNVTAGEREGKWKDERGSTSILIFNTSLFLQFSVHFMI